MVTPGTRQTEMGEIPADWEVRALGSLGNFRKGRGISRADVESSGLPCVRYGELYTRHHFVIREFFSFVSPAAALRAEPLRRGDLIFTTSGETLEEIGKSVAYLGPTGDAYVGGDTAILAPEAADSEFLGYALEHPSVTAQKARFGQGDAVAHISAGRLAQVKAPLPPLAEQRRIAEVLSRVDDLIESLDDLIAKKRAVKAAAMDDLLTGRRRLPGFDTGAGSQQTELGEIPADWELRALGSLGTFRKGRGISRADVEPAGLPCIRYGELYTRHHFVIREFFSFVSPPVARKSEPLRQGDLIFTTSGETLAEIGKSVAYLGSTGEAFVGGDTAILAPDSAESAFLGYALEHPSVTMQKARFGQGDTVAHISAARLAQVKAPLPPIAEQRRIAEMLSAMDEEIEVLSARRGKTVAVKAALMDELLTGRTRLL